jgi:hypothetical protein
MHVRPAEPKDIPQLVNLGRQLFDLHLEFDGAYYQTEDNFAEHFSEWIKNQIANPSALLLIAENETDQSIAGFISGFMKSLYPWFKTKTVGHISYLIIRPEFRNAWYRQNADGGSRRLVQTKKYHLSGSLRGGKKRYRTAGLVFLWLSAFQKIPAEEDLIFL